MSGFFVVGGAFYEYGKELKNDFEIYLEKEMDEGRT